MRKIFAALFICLASGSALAATAPSTKVLRVSSSEMLSGVALNAAAGTRTMTVTTARSWAKLRLRVAYTYSAATSVTLTPTCSYDGTNFTAPVTRSCSSGSCEVAPHTDVETGTASFDLMFDYDVRGCQKFKVVFSGGGSPGAGDLVTTQAVAIVGD